MLKLKIVLAIIKAIFVLPIIRAPQMIKRDVKGYLQYIVGSPYILVPFVFLGALTSWVIAVISFLTFCTIWISVKIVSKSQ